MGRVRIEGNSKGSRARGKSIGKNMEKANRERQRLFTRKARVEKTMKKVTFPEKRRTIIQTKSIFLHIFTKFRIIFTDGS